MDTEQALRGKLSTLSFLVFGIAAMAGVVGLTGITSVPAIFGVYGIALVGPFYYLIALISVFINRKKDNAAFNQLTDEERKTYADSAPAHFNTISQHNTFASTVALTIILPAALTLLGFIVLSPGGTEDLGHYDRWLMSIGTALVVASIWMFFANHRNLFDKNYRLAQKLATRDSINEYKVIRLNLIWSRIIWNIGGVLSIILLYSFITGM
jgi:uncharacterized membrane protein